MNKVVKKLLIALLAAGILFLPLKFTVFAEETQVTSEEELKQAISNNANIRVIWDISLQSTIVIEDISNLTINLDVFQIENSTGKPLFIFKNCRNIRIISDISEEPGQISAQIPNGIAYSDSEPYHAITLSGTDLTIENINMKLTAMSYSPNADLLYAENTSRVKILNSDLKAERVGGVITANGSSLWLGKSEAELTSANLPGRMSTVTIDNMSYPNEKTTGGTVHAGAITLKNGSLLESFADILVNEVEIPGSPDQSGSSVSAILSDESGVDIQGGTVECNVSASSGVIAAYGIESHKPLESSGLRIRYAANDFDASRLYGTEICSTQGAVFVSPDDLKHTNQAVDYRMQIDYASLVAADGFNAITAVGKEGAVKEDLRIDTGAGFLLGKVIYRQEVDGNVSERLDEDLSYLAYDRTGTGGSRAVCLNRSLLASDAYSMNCENVNLAIRNGAVLTLNRRINGAEGDSSRLLVFGELILNEPCLPDIYVYGKATIAELTASNFYSMSSGKIYFDAATLRFTQNEPLVYNKERQVPEFTAWYGSRKVEDLSPGNLISFKQGERFQISSKTSSNYIFAGTNREVTVSPANTGSPDSCFYMTGECTANFTIQKAVFAAVNPGQDLSVKLTSNPIRYGYKEVALIKNFPYDDDKREYQWYRVTKARQEILLEGETDYEYIVQKEDIGNQIFCRVSFGNYSDVLDSDRALVEKGTPSETTGPTDPTRPSETTGPTNPTRPSETTGPTESAAPSESAKPSESGKPSESRKTETPTVSIPSASQSAAAQSAAASTEAKPTPSDAAITGDTSKILLWIALLAVSGIGAVVAAYFFVKKRS